MEAKVNYTVVGMCVIILGAALIATALWLSVGLNQKSYNTYAVFLNEAASGLSEDAAVRYNGVKVGYVRQISLNHNNPNQVILLLNIEAGTPITINTKATLISQGITGVSYLGLSDKGSNLAPLKAPKNYPFPIIPAKPSLFTQIDKAVREVADNVSSVTKEIQRVFDTKNAQYIRNTLQSMEKFSHNLEENNQKISAILQNTDILSRNLATSSEELPKLTQAFKKSVHGFQQTTTALTQAGNSVSATMDDSRSAINKLSQQTIPAATGLIQRLDTVTNNLEKISNLMRRNPSVILRGTPEKPPGPGEK